MPSPKSARKIAGAKRPAITAPKRLHLDKRVETILAAAANGGDDDLLTTREEALWLGVSEAWLEGGRAAGYGPPFVLLGPRMIRYQRGATRAYLRKRAFTTVAAAQKRRAAEMA